jgi:hypothetical protein
MSKSEEIFKKEEGEDILTVLEERSLEIKNIKPKAHLNTDKKLQKDLKKKKLSQALRANLNRRKIS